MKKTVILVPLAFILLAARLQSTQIADPSCEVATWRGFKTAAVSYTFDDNTPNQLLVAVPKFDLFGFKATLFTVTGWVTDWSGQQAAALKGHEVASHTVDHVRLGGLSIADETYQYAASKAAIISNSGNEPAFTIAYPNCRSGDVALCSQYYIAGRNCSGAIVPPTPPNFFEINSYICGSRGTVKTTADFISRFNSAQSAGGWLVLLLHGIDNDGGYSPLPSKVLLESLQYLDGNRNAFWVETFGNVVRYIKERDSLSVTKIAEDPIELVVTDSLDNNVYNYPITLRRLLPQGWTEVAVTQNGAAIPSAVVKLNSSSYVVFDAVPDAGNVIISNATQSQAPAAPYGLSATAGHEFGLPDLELDRGYRKHPRWIQHLPYQPARLHLCFPRIGRVVTNLLHGQHRYRWNHLLLCCHRVQFSGAGKPV